MLKMTIDNEEVVSKNNFTIKEEMLSPSSTILNNTYPKTWEDDKNYTSRFYYPKDYAKLDIQNFSITPEEAGTTIDIVGSTTLTDVDTTKESRVLSLKGQTSQTGTPTPTSPIPVNVVSGDNEINICGKNLFPNNITSQTISGVSFSKNEDGSISLNGTATAGIRVWLSDKPIKMAAGTYSISASKTGTITTNVYMSLRDVANTQDYTYINLYTTTLHRTKTFSEDTMCLPSIYITNGNVISNVKVYTMLEVGSTSTTYEPYIGNTYPIYLGVENLSPISSLSTTNGGYINASTGHFGDVIAGKTYTVQFKNNSSYTNQLDVRVFHDNTYTSQLNKNLVANGIVEFTFTASNTGYIALNGKVASDTTDIFTDIKTTEGNHLQYISTTPIELCKIGTYQDYIYKDNGSWYLHKEIGKVVLDGSENISLTTTGTNYTRFNVAITGVILGSASTYTLIRSNYYFPEYAIEPGAIFISSTQNIVGVVHNSVITLADYKTWLSTNKPIIYYVLATPTNTEITDTLLLSQLNDLESE